MTDRVLVLLPDGRCLAFADESAFREALRVGADTMAATTAQPVPFEEALSAAAVAKMFNLPESWIEAAGRDGRIPCIEAGRWRRFYPSAVKKALIANGKA
jgi:hypothetical protein